MQQVIKIENLTYIYNPKTPFAKKALDKVNLEINKGDFLGIIGHTGCGKSTLIQHLNGLLKPQTGVLNVLDFDLFDRKIKKRYKSLRSKIGMVFQYPEYQLFAENVFLDVAFGYKNFFSSKTHKLSKEEIETAVKDAVTLVGLDYDQIKNRSPFEISGGQKRRIAIAGVIVSKPEILILDEPTAGLDPKGKAEILKLIHNLHKTCCHTIIMISHDMDEIAKNCNKIALMENGKIIKVGTQDIFDDINKIKELNLDLPNCVKINLSLKEKGFDTGKNVFFEKELAELIAKKITRRKC